jgi:hypothetical protein
MEKLDSKFTFFQAPFMAFFNRDLYRDVATNWKGSGALYIFLLTSAAWLVSFIVGTALPIMQVMNNKDFAGFMQQVPKMVIVDGKLSIDKPAGYEMKDPKTGSPIIRFAMDRKVAEIKQGDPPLVITETDVVMRADGHAYKSATDSSDDEASKSVMKWTDVSKLFSQKVEVDSASLQAGISQILTIVPIAILFVFWPFIFLGHLIQMLIFGGVGILIANGMNKEMPFETAMRLSAIAITPAIVISVALTVLRATVPPLSLITGFWGFTSVAVSVAYLIVIIRSLPTPEVQATTPNR